jgi:hypothetical protein
MFMFFKSTQKDGYSDTLVMTQFEKKIWDSYDGKFNLTWLTSSASSWIVYL